MAKEESKLYQKIKKALPNVHFQRIETNIALGVPDVNGCYQGIEFWLELKVKKGKQTPLTKYQKAWIVKRASHGGKVFIINFDLGQRAVKLYDYNSCVNRDPFATLPVSHFPHPVSWPAVLNKIITHQGSPSRQQEAGAKIIKK